MGFNITRAQNIHPLQVIRNKDVVVDFRRKFEPQMYNNIQVRLDNSKCKHASHQHDVQEIGVTKCKF